MSLATAGIGVSKRRSAVPRNDEAVRIRSEVAAKARIAAAYAGESISEYLSRILDPILTEAIEQGHAKISEAASVKKKAKALKKP